MISTLLNSLQWYAWISTFAAEYSRATNGSQCIREKSSVVVVMLVDDKDVPTVKGDHSKGTKARQRNVVEVVEMCRLPYWVMKRCAVGDVTLSCRWASSSFNGVPTPEAWWSRHQIWPNAVSSSWFGNLNALNLYSLHSIYSNKTINNHVLQGIS